jgi:hypothetical protein
MRKIQHVISIVAQPIKIQHGLSELKSQARFVNTTCSNLRKPLTVAVFDVQEKIVNRKECILSIKKGSNSCSIKMEIEFLLESSVIYKTVI